MACGRRVCHSWVQKDGGRLILCPEPVTYKVTLHSRELGKVVDFRCEHHHWVSATKYSIPGLAVVERV